MEAERAAVRIFDLVDAHKIGQAEGALETALAKYPDNDSLRAAEALVLLRLDQQERAKERAVALSSKPLKEPKAINALVHVLQQCCCWESLAAVYERLRPLQNDRNISENLVQTYVRMGACAKAQQTATQMYRAHADPKYQVWMVQACLGQVPVDSKDHLMLKLATKLLDASVLTEKGVMTPATVRTYIDVLAQQELYTEAVDFLCSERGAKVGLLETRLEVLARVLAKAGRRTLANAAAKKLWQMHPDNWTPFEIYSDTLDEGEEATAADPQAVLTLAAEKPELRATVSAADGDHTMEDALALARSLQEAQKDAKKPQRGPFLAELSLLDCAKDTRGLASAVLAYVQRFYRKPCCFLDVSTFLTAASSADIYAWSKEGTSVDGTLSDADKIAAHTKRILGLRCYVASWGITQETLPSADEMKALMATCAETYEAAKPLSTSLEWNEEGHCDAYISVALNVALHAYYASGKNATWLVEALALMQQVDRRMNNSVWLIYSACMGGLLGLADTAAHHQLAFKSVQHDTMSHIGYWPLVRSLAQDDVATWDALAAEYYKRVERDCSLLRAKVFTFTSWPAMQDVRRFQTAQESSLARWLCAPQEVASRLPDCQTQKNIMELFESLGADLWQSWEVLGRPTAEADLVDNTDWTVARSVVLGNIHSDKVRMLTEALVDMPSFAQRLALGRKLLCSLLFLADVTAVEHRRQAARNAPKPRKGKKGAAAVEAATTTSEEEKELFTARLTEKGRQASMLTCLPAVAPVAAALLPTLVPSGASTDGEAGAAAATAAKAANEALGAHLEQLLAAPTAHAFEAFLYPEAYILAALLRVVPLTAAPVALWATTLHAGLEAALAKYDNGEWYFMEGDAAVVAAAEAEPFTHALMQEKAKRVRGFVSDLLVDIAASGRRK